MSWSQAPLGRVARFLGGGTPSKSNPAFWSGDIPWVSPKDMAHRELFDAEDHVSPEAIDSSATQVVPAGSILIVVRSGILVRHIPIAIARRSVALNQDMKALVPTDAVLPEFLAYVIEWQGPVILKSCVRRGATVHSIDIAKLRELPVPVPPIPEQHRIVAILDETDRLRKLRIEADAKADRVLPALFIRTFGDSAQNPMNWPIRELSSCFQEKPNYGTMRPPLSTPAQFLDLRVKNIVGDRLNLSDRKYVQLQQNEVPRHSLRDGDLIIARAIGSRSHLGKCVVVYPGHEQWSFDSHLMRVRLNAEVLVPEYLWAFLNSTAGRQEFLRLTRNSAVQFNINVPEFSSIKIPVPPIPLQAEFRARVNALSELQEKRQHAESHLNRLFRITARWALEPRKGHRPTVRPKSARFQS